MSEEYGLHRYRNENGENGENSKNIENSQNIENGENGGKNVNNNENANNSKNENNTYRPADNGNLPPTQELSPQEEKLLRKEEKELKRQKNARLRAAKKERRENERKRALGSVHKRPIICPPDKGASGITSVILGYVCRILILWMAVFSVAFFVADAFALTSDFGVGTDYILLRGFIFTALLSVAVLAPWWWLKIAGVSAALGVAILDLLPDPIGTLKNIIPNTYGALQNHLSDAGYFKEEMVVDGELIPAAITLLILFLSIIYVVFMVKRIRILVPATVSAVILWSVFVFNLSRSNWGITLIIASFSALLVMSVYDRIYIREANGESVDTTIDLFDKDENSFPIETSTEIKERKHRKREERRKAMAERRQLRRDYENGTLTVSVDDELAYYFSEKPKRKNKDLTPGEKESQKAAKRAEKEEKRRQKREEKRERQKAKRQQGRILDAKCAVGGFAGVGMFALAMLLLIIPATMVTGRFKTIDVIDRKVDFYRRYVTAWLMGDDPALDILALEGDSSNFDSVSTEATPRNYKNIPVMRVDTNVKKYPVYLRRWVGTKYEDGKWLTAEPNSELLTEYRDLFSTDTDPGEEMLYGFWKSLDGSLIPDDLEYTRSSKVNSYYGIAISQVNVKCLDIKSRLLNIPSFNIRKYTSVPGTSASGSGADFLRVFGGSEASDLTYANYFDGMYSSYRAGVEPASYATVSILTSMKTASTMRNISEMITNHNLMRYAALGTRTNTSDFSLTNTMGLPLTYKGYCISYTYTEKRYGQVVESTTEYTINYWIADDPYEKNKRIRYEVTSEDAGSYFVEYLIYEDGRITKHLLTDQYGGYSEEVRLMPDLPYSIRYYEVLTEAEQEQFLDTLKLEDEYTDFVYRNYTGRSGSDIIKETYRKITSEATETVTVPTTVYDEETGQTFEIDQIVEVPADFSRASERNEYKITTKSGKKNYGFVRAVTEREVYLKRHQLVMALVDYLADPENYTYTLNPAPCDTEGLDGIEKFLTVTHEGYCVQYASAVVLMLREAGIPARFVEGYIATDFKNVPKDYLPDVENPYVGSFTTTVLDSNAHAWIEVWYDGIGWVQYETTPMYYSDMYYVKGGDNDNDPGHISPPIPPTDPGDDDPTDPPDTDVDVDVPPIVPGVDDPGDIIDRQRAERRALILRIIKTVAICLVSATVIFTTVFLIIRRAKRAEKERRALFDKLTCAPDAEIKPSREEVGRAARLITRLLEECGSSPNIGEFRDEYAARIAKEYAVPLSASSKKEKNGNRKNGDVLPVNEERIGRMLDAIAAEEFGFGAPVKDLPLMAEFYRRMYEFQYRRKVSPLRRFWLYVVTCEM